MRKHFMYQTRILHVQKNLVVLPSNDYAMHIRSIYSQTQNFVMKIKQRTLNTTFLVNPFKRVYVIESKYFIAELHAKYTLGATLR